MSLALSLWDTENIDARLLATLIIKPNELSVDEMDKIVQSVKFNQVADWLNAYVVKNHPEKETLRQLWMASDEPMAARAGWSLTASRVVKRSRRAGTPCDSGSHRVRNGERRSRSAMDDELHSCGNRNPLPRPPQAGARHRRDVGNLSRLSRFQGLHLTLRPDLDQRNGEPTWLSYQKDMKMNPRKKVFI